MEKRTGPPRLQTLVRKKMFLDLTETLDNSVAEISRVRNVFFSFWGVGSIGMGHAM